MVDSYVEDGAGFRVDEEVRSEVEGEVVLTAGQGSRVPLVPPNDNNHMGLLARRSIGRLLGPKALEGTARASLQEEDPGLCRREEDGQFLLHLLVHQ